MERCLTTIVMRSEGFPTDDESRRLGRLTAREREVLGWLAEGKRDAEIATILSTSVHTVHKHVQHILLKLAVENRTAAAALLLRRGPSSPGA